MRTRKQTSKTFPVVLALSLLLPITARADAIDYPVLVATQAEIAQQTAKMAEMLAKAQETIRIANESLGVAKDAYAGVQYFATLDPKKIGDEALRIARTFGIVNQAESTYNQMDALTKQGINGGNFNITSPMAIYDKATGTWKKVVKLTNNDEDIALQGSEERKKARDAATKRLEGEDAKGTVNTADALRFIAGDTVDTNIMDTEAAIRGASNIVGKQASDAAAEASGAGMNTSKAAYITAQMTSISAQQLALLNKQVATLVSYQSIDAVKKQNDKEKADLAAEQAEQIFNENQRKMLNEKSEINPNMIGWHDDIVGGF